jgi:hypothetical protein
MYVKGMKESGRPDVMDKAAFEKRRSLAAFMYEIPVRPWAIGYGSYISNYLEQAYMTQVVKPTDVPLEIGTGSGFQSASSRTVRGEVGQLSTPQPLPSTGGQIADSTAMLHEVLPKRDGVVV